MGFAIVGSSSCASEAASGDAASGDALEFPLRLESYGDENFDGIGAKLRNRIEHDPFNLVAAIIFLCAIIHTFMASKFMSVTTVADTRMPKRSRKAKQETDLRMFSVRQCTFLVRSKSYSVCG